MLTYFKKCRYGITFKDFFTYSMKPQEVFEKFKLTLPGILARSLSPHIESPPGINPFPHCILHFIPITFWKPNSFAAFEKKIKIKICIPQEIYFKHFDLQGVPQK